MMARLAYMTGPPGRPLRAGSSVNDIMGGMFGVIGALPRSPSATHTGKGQEVQVGLFENCVLLSAQHMLQYTRPASHRRRCRTASMPGACSTCSTRRRRTGVPRRRHRHPVGGVRPRLRSRRPRERSAACQQQSARRGAPWMLPALREIVGATPRRTAGGVRARGLPYARSSSRSSCSTIRTCSRAAGSPT